MRRRCATHVQTVEKTSPESLPLLMPMAFEQANGGSSDALGNGGCLL